MYHFRWFAHTHTYTDFAQGCATCVRVKLQMQRIWQSIWLHLPLSIAFCSHCKWRAITKMAALVQFPLCLVSCSLQQFSRGGENDKGTHPVSFASFVFIFDVASSLSSSFSLFHTRWQLLTLLTCVAVYRPALFKSSVTLFLSISCAIFAAPLPSFCSSFSLLSWHSISLCYA